MAQTGSRADWEERKRKEFLRQTLLLPKGEKGELLYNNKSEFEINKMYAVH